MNILYISHLYESVASGMNWSVPASVDAQSKIDNVLWVEMSDARMEHWTKVESYHNYQEYPGKGLKRFPTPFSNPDIVVFEGFFFMSDVFLSYELKKKGIPYIIIPRGSFTYTALHNKSYIKKKIANFLFFKKFVKDAIAVQFLTKNECDTSINNFEIGEYFIIPNGVNLPSISKTEFSKTAIKGSFIGRLDIVHKGIDLLLDAIYQLKNDLSSANFTLDIYGPMTFDYKNIQKMIKDKQLDNIVFLKGVISGERKKEVLLSTDVFIMTSRFEGHPMGLIESLAYGIPCVITKGTNMRPEVETFDAGWTCDNDVESVKLALLSLLSDKHLLMSKGTNARTLAEEYDWHKLAVKFHDEVNNII